MFVQNFIKLKTSVHELSNRINRGKNLAKMVTTLLSSPP